MCTVVCSAHMLRCCCGGCGGCAACMAAIPSLSLLRPRSAIPRPTWRPCSAIRWRSSRAMALPAGRELFCFGIRPCKARLRTSAPRPTLKQLRCLPTSSVKRLKRSPSRARARSPSCWCAMPVIGWSRISQDWRRGLPHTARATRPRIGARLSAHCLPASWLGLFPPTPWSWASILAA